MTPGIDRFMAADRAQRQKWFAQWLKPSADMIRGMGYRFLKEHFGRTYDGSFGEIKTTHRVTAPVRLIWVDLTSMKEAAWLKLYFFSEDQQKASLNALMASEMAATKLADYSCDCSKDGHKDAPWYVGSSMPFREVLASGNPQAMIAEWIRDSIDVATAGTNSVDRRA